MILPKTQNLTVEITIATINKRNNQITIERQGEITLKYSYFTFIELHHFGVLSLRDGEFNEGKIFREST